MKQHGFRKKWSAVTQLVATIQGIASSLQSGKDQVDVVLLDFSKVFNRFPRQQLLYKLNFYGVRGEILEWIRSFLGHRKQQVLLDGCKSAQADVISGMPQGTVLGPLLFLADISDLPEAVDHSDSCLFADDCLVCKLFKSDTDAMRLQEDLEALEEWEKLWQMQFHPEKCQVIRINHNKCLERKTDYKLQGHTLEVLDSGKYPRVNISSDLSWHTHVDAMAAILYGHSLPSTDSRRTVVSFWRKNVHNTG